MKNKAKVIILTFIFLLQCPIHASTILQIINIGKKKTPKQVKKVEKDTQKVTHLMSERKNKFQQAFNSQASSINNLLLAIEKKDKKKFKELLKNINLDESYWVRVSIGFSEEKYKITNMKLLPFLIIHGWDYGFQIVFQKLKKKKGFSVNQTDQGKRTLLMHAASYGYLSIVQYLIKQSTPQDQIDFFVGYNLKYPNPYIATALGKAFELMSYAQRGQHFSHIKGREHRNIVNLLAAKMLQVITEKKDMGKLKQLILKNQLLKIIRLNRQDGLFYEFTLTKDQMKPAGWLAKHGWLEGLQYLLCSMREIDQVQNRSGRTLLMISAQAGHLDVVKYLTAKKHIAITLEDDHGWTSLMLASKFGYEKIVEHLIRKGYEKLGEKSYYDHWDDSLFHAVAQKKLSVIKMLIQLKKEGMIQQLSMNTLNLRIKKSKTALLKAIQDGNKEVVLTLLNALAGPLKEDNKIETDHYGNSAVMYAVGHNHGVILEYLVDTTNHLIPTEVQNLFIQSINQGNQHHETALMYAAENGYAYMVPILVRAGADINLQEASGWTAAMYASQEGHLVFLEKIYQVTQEAIRNSTDELTRKRLTINIDLKSNDGLTAIMHACKSGQLKVVEFLEKQGANLLISAKNGLNIFLHACWQKHINIVKYLLKVAENPEQHLMNQQVNSKENREAFRQALIYTAEQHHQRTALMLATINGDITIVQLLINHEKATYADQHPQHQWTWHKQDINGWNILSQAAAYGYKTIVEYLLTPEHNLNLEIDQADREGKPPLSLASEYGHLEIVKLLVEEGADVLREDQKGNDALNYALQGSSNQHVAIANYLYATFKKKHTRNTSTMQMEKILKELGANSLPSRETTPSEEKNSSLSEKENFLLEESDDSFFETDLPPSQKKEHNLTPRDSTPSENSEDNSMKRKTTSSEEGEYELSPRELTTSKKTTLPPTIEKITAPESINYQVTTEDLTLARENSSTPIETDFKESQQIHDHFTQKDSPPPLKKNGNQITHRKRRVATPIGSNTKYEINNNISNETATNQGTMQKDLTDSQNQITEEEIIAGSSLGTTSNQHNTSENSPNRCRKLWVPLMILGLGTIGLLVRKTKRKKTPVNAPKGKKTT